MGPLIDAFNAFQRAITQVDPSSDMSTLAAADQALTHKCEALHAYS